MWKDEIEEAVRARLTMKFLMRRDISRFEPRPLAGYLDATCEAVSQSSKSAAFVGAS